MYVHVHVSCDYIIKNNYVDTCTVAVAVSTQ